MRTLDYHIVDVFAVSPLQGNPLAVVMNSSGLTAEQMQAIACEFNLSETTFIERRAAAQERSDGVRVRIFTTQEELNFAGHPTLGTAAVLKQHARQTMQGNTVTLALNVGPISVRFANDDLFGEMRQRDPQFGEQLDPSEAARLIGLSQEDLDAALPPQVVSTGTPFAIVVLHAAQSLARLKVNHDQATPWLRERGARWFYVLARDPSQGSDSDPMWRARMQFYGGEDPATGSAAGCAISYLARRDAVPSGVRVHLRQGVEIGRPSDIFLCADTSGPQVTNVRVAGSTVFVAKGQLFLP